MLCRLLRWFAAGSLSSTDATLLRLLINSQKLYGLKSLSPTSFLQTVGIHWTFPLRASCRLLSITVGSSSQFGASFLKPVSSHTSCAFIMHGIVRHATSSCCFSVCVPSACVPWSSELETWLRAWANQPHISAPHLSFGSIAISFCFFFCFLFLSSSDLLNLGLEALKWRAIDQMNTQKIAEKRVRKLLQWQLPNWL